MICKQTVLKETMGIAAHLTGGLGRSSSAQCLRLDEVQSALFPCY